MEMVGEVLVFNCGRRLHGCSFHALRRCLFIPPHLPASLLPIITSRHFTSAMFNRDSSHVFVKRKRVLCRCASDTRCRPRMVLAAGVEIEVEALIVRIDPFLALG